MKDDHECTDALYFFMWEMGDCYASCGAIPLSCLYTFLYLRRLVYRVDDPKILDTHYCYSGHVYNTPYQMKGLFDSYG